MLYRSNGSSIPGLSVAKDKKPSTGVGEVMSIEGLPKYPQTSGSAWLISMRAGS